MTKEEFVNEILKQRNEYYAQFHKWPNELRIGSQWQDVFQEIAYDWELTQTPDIHGKVKHWWFMGMRCFNEIFSHGVDWSRETAKLKRKMRFA